MHAPPLWPCRRRPHAGSARGDTGDAAHMPDLLVRRRRRRSRRRASSTTGQATTAVAVADGEGGRIYVYWLQRTHACMSSSLTHAPDILKKLLHDARMPHRQAGRHGQKRTAGRVTVHNVNPGQACLKNCHAFDPATVKNERESGHAMLPACLAVHSSHTRLDFTGRLR